MIPGWYLKRVTGTLLYHASDIRHKTEHYSHSPLASAIEGVATAANSKRCQEGILLPIDVVHVYSKEDIQTLALLVSYMSMSRQKAQQVYECWGTDTDTGWFSLNPIKSQELEVHVVFGRL